MNYLEKAKEERATTLTLSEAATYLKVCRQTLVRLAQKGELPHWKVGRQYRFSRDTLGDYLRRS